MEISQKRKGDIMKDFYIFAETNPILTFFLFWVIGWAVSESFKGLGNIFRNK